jgi:hypothetical protein
VARCFWCGKNSDRESNLRTGERSVAGSLLPVLAIVRASNLQASHTSEEGLY